MGHYSIDRWIIYSTVSETVFYWKTKEIRKLLHLYGITMVTRGPPGNHIFTCPTSGGKTLVGELLLLNAVLTRSTDALLVLPYVALVEEKVGC